MTATQFWEKSRAEALPGGVEKTGFMSLILDAVQAVDWPGKGKEFALRSGEELTSDSLMTVVVYCYATGVYASPEIEQRCIHDPEARRLCLGKAPGWKSIRQFRKTHRQAVKQCLAHICEQALRIRFGDGESEPPLADYYVALALDRWFEPLCVPSPPDEAENRVGKASFIDGMSSVD